MVLRPWRASASESRTGERGTSAHRRVSCLPLANGRGPAPPSTKVQQRDVDDGCGTCPSLTTHLAVVVERAKQRLAAVGLLRVALVQRRVEVGLDQKQEVLKQIPLRLRHGEDAPCVPHSGAQLRESGPGRRTLR